MVQLKDFFLASTSGDTNIIIWNWSTGEQARTLSGHKDYVRGIIKLWDPSIIGTCSEDQTIIIWNWENQTILD
jgi:WD40 repeat protein